MVAANSLARVTKQPVLDKTAVPQVCVVVAF